MDLSKCDRCKKMISKPLDNGSISVRTYGTRWGGTDFCSRCAPAFLRFLKKYAKIKEQKSDKKR